MSPHGTLGMAEFSRRNIPEALFHLHTALRQGEDPGVHAFERWAGWMMLGEFEEAWKECDRLPCPFALPAADSLCHARIRCVRGLGDAIQFLRFAPVLRRLSLGLHVEVNERLLPLLRHFNGFEEGVTCGPHGSGVTFDFDIEASHLPYLFRTTLATIPHHRGYVHLPPEHPVNGRKRPFRVGIAWRAGEWCPERSIPASLLAPLCCTGASFVNLQRELTAAELACLPPDLLLEPLPPPVTLLGTARLLQGLDLIISVDTMVAHLAGAMGLSVWILLPFAADWRWLLDRTDSPWYASARLFRQPSPGNWISVLNKVDTELRKLFTE